LILLHTVISSSSKERALRQQSSPAAAEGIQIQAGISIVKDVLLVVILYCIEKVLFLFKREEGINLFALIFYFVRRMFWSNQSNNNVVSEQKRRFFSVGHR